MSQCVDSEEPLLLRRDLASPAPPAGKRGGGVSPSCSGVPPGLSSATGSDHRTCRSPRGARQLEGKELEAVQSSAGRQADQGARAANAGHRRHRAAQDGWPAVHSTRDRTFTSRASAQGPNKPGPPLAWKATGWSQASLSGRLTAAMSSREKEPSPSPPWITCPHPSARCPPILDSDRLAHPAAVTHQSRLGVCVCGGEAEQVWIAAARHAAAGR